MELIVHAALVAFFLMCCSCMVQGCHACWRRMGVSGTAPEAFGAARASAPTTQATVEADPPPPAFVAAEAEEPTTSPPPPSWPQTQPSPVRHRRRVVFMTFKGKVVHGRRECGPLRQSRDIIDLRVCLTCGDDAAVGMWSVGDGRAHGRSNCREIGRNERIESRRACKISACWTSFAHPGPRDSILDMPSGVQ